jgi:hypothetical protein
MTRMVSNVYAKSHTTRKGGVGIMADSSGGMGHREYEYPDGLGFMQILARCGNGRGAVTAYGSRMRWPGSCVHGWVDPADDRAGTRV